MHSRNNRIVVLSLIALGFVAAIFNPWFSIQTPLGSLDVNGVRGNIQLLTTIPIWFLASISILGVLVGIFNVSRLTSLNRSMAFIPLLFSGAFYLAPILRQTDSSHFGLLLAIALTAVAIPAALLATSSESNQHLSITDQAKSGDGEATGQR